MRFGRNERHNISHVADAPMRNDGSGPRVRKLAGLTRQVFSRQYDGDAGDFHRLIGIYRKNFRMDMGAPERLSDERSRKIQIVKIYRGS